MPVDGSRLTTSLVAIEKAAVRRIRKYPGSIGAQSPYSALLLSLEMIEWGCNHVVQGYDRLDQRWSVVGMAILRRRSNVAPVERATPTRAVI